jgi:hypothetical protein
MLMRISGIHFLAVGLFTDLGSFKIAQKVKGCHQYDCSPNKN